MTTDQVLTIVGILTSSFLVGMGGAMAWFRGQRIKLEADVNDLRCEVRSQLDDHHENDRDIAVLKTEIRNNVERLDEINDATKETNRKLDRLSDALTDVLLAVNKRP